MEYADSLSHIATTLNSPFNVSEKSISHVLALLLNTHVDNLKAKPCERILSDQLDSESSRIDGLLIPDRDLLFPLYRGNSCTPCCISNHLSASSPSTMAESTGPDVTFQSQSFEKKDTSTPKDWSKISAFPDSLFASEESQPPRQKPTFVTTMPYPGTMAAPYFDGSSITEFLETYEDMCNDYQVCDKEKLRQMPRYCESLTESYIKTLAEFVEDDYQDLKEVLRVEYKGEDPVQQKATKSYLEILKNKPWKNDEDVSPYCREYATISQKLVAERRLDLFTQRQ